MSEQATGTRPWYRPGPTGRRVIRWALIVGIVVVVVTAVPYAWVRITAAGHLYDAADLAGGHGPHADVVLVLGAEVEPDRVNPKPYLRGRLDTAAAIYQSGNARVVLVSGDAGGQSGNEPRVMTNYLIGHGVPSGRIVADPYGLDTYDSCRRARDVFGVHRLLIVTQSYHLPRAVALCRSLGIDTDGVRARCDSCDKLQLVRNSLRDYLAASKAALDLISGRDPAVSTPPSDAVDRALTS